MKSICIGEQTIELDNNGFLVNLDDWSKPVARELAKLENVALTEEHWEILYLLRRFYQEFTIAPAMRILVKQVKSELGAKKGSSLYLLRLFPESPAKIGCKIAGLPKPTNCL